MTALGPSTTLHPHQHRRAQKTLRLKLEQQRKDFPLFHINGGGIPANREISLEKLKNIVMEIGAASPVDLPPFRAG